MNSNEKESLLTSQFKSQITLLVQNQMCSISQTCRTGRGRI